MQQPTYDPLPQPMWNYREFIVEAKACGPSRSVHVIFDWEPAASARESVFRFLRAVRRVQTWPYADKPNVAMVRGMGVKFSGETGPWDLLYAPFLNPNAFFVTRFGGTVESGVIGPIQFDVLENMSQPT